jgi:hypothetical protein
MSKEKALEVFRVELNGTDTNPYHKFGMKMNPFPQLADNKYDAATMAVQSLAGDPIPHDNFKSYIRERLHGKCSEEFIELCIQNFRPGQRVVFHIKFPV